MPITKDLARELAARLDRSLSNASHDKIREIVDTLYAVATNEAEARSFIASWENSYQAPAAGDIRVYFEDRHAQSSPRRPKCALCDGCTFIGADYLIEYWPGTYNIRARRKLVAEEPQAIRPTLGPDHAIVGAAEPCPKCRPNYHDAA